MDLNMRFESEFEDPSCPSGVCPPKLSDYPIITAAHGGGGRLTHKLIKDFFLRALGNEVLAQLHDSAYLTLPTNKIAYTTDSFVVSPIFFPGGNIGDLAVNGTVNDLAMAGAKPLFLSLGVILEEGFPTEKLWDIVISMREALKRVGAKVVTGDLKVVEKGKGDGIYINTSGIGVIEHDLDISPKSIRKGDLIILSGDVGRHAIAVMSVREGLFNVQIESDTAPLHEPVLKMIEEGVEVHCLRDVTRGGLATVLTELAEASGLTMTVYEDRIPILEPVMGACEILGLDPLYLASEGRFVAVIPEKDSDKALGIMRSFEVSKDAVVIGEVTDEYPSKAVLRTVIGTDRILEMLSGEQLPRIC